MTGGVGAKGRCQRGGRHIEGIIGLRKRSRKPIGTEKGRWEKPARKIACGTQPSKKVKLVCRKDCGITVNF